MADEVKNADTAPAANDTTGGENTGDTGITESVSQDATGADKQQPMEWYMNPILWIAVLAWIWLIRSWRKQKKKQEERKNELDAIKKGVKVVTIGRIHGEVVSSTSETVTIKPDKKSDFTMTFDRVAIHRIESKDGKKEGEAE